MDRTEKILKGRKQQSKDVKEAIIKEKKALERQSRKCRYCEAIAHKGNVCSKKACRSRSKEDNEVVCDEAPKVLTKKCSAIECNRLVALSVHRYYPN
jgi:hypothetical protein